jgi:ABC-2 type transport system ATP-binding protein
MSTQCSTEEIVINATNIHKRFKNVHAVNDLSLSINRGEFVALLGPNGAGKTTLVEMIEGLQKPSSGDILVLGKSWKNNATYLHSKIGLALQETKLIDKLTVSETLDLFGSFYGRDSARSQEIIKLIGLKEKTKSLVDTLSGGQKQRLALGIAIINQPEILILDEPTMGLDPHGRHEIWNILRELKKRCTTLILTTHYMEEAEMLCDRIYIMHKGKILTQGNLQELLAAHGDGEVIEFSLDGTLIKEAFLKQSEVLKFHWDEVLGQGQIIVKNAATFLPRLYQVAAEQQLTIKSLTSRKKTLDDLFISLTGRHLDE